MEHRRGRRRVGGHDGGADTRRGMPKIKGWIFDTPRELRSTSCGAIADAPEYERRGREAVAAFQRGDMAAYDDCCAKQNALGRFQPVISHSPVEGSPACVFHIQVLQDFMTIDEITHKLFDEINNFKPVPRGCFSWIARLWPWR